MLLVRRWRELGRLGGGFLRVSVRFLISLSGSILLFDASVVLFFLYFFCFSFVLPLSSSLLFVTASHYSYLNLKKSILSFVFAFCCWSFSLFSFAPRVGPLLPLLRFHSYFAVCVRDSSTILSDACSVNFCRTKVLLKEGGRRLALNRAQNCELREAVAFDAPSRRDRAWKVYRASDLIKRRELNPTLRQEK